jgi:predicted TPR repeat methyltransferase
MKRRKRGKAAQKQSVTELGIDEALRLAVQLHQQRMLDAAETLYRRILEAAPEHPDALHFLGMLRHERGSSEEAVALIERAIGHVPAFAGFHNNLGNIQALRGDVPAATAAYERGIALAPDSADLYNNLGALYRLQGRPDEAESCCRRAIELDPAHVNAWNNLGLLEQARGDVKSAVWHFCKAITLAPARADGRTLLGQAYYRVGMVEEARQVYREWLELEPNHPVAVHMYAACLGAAAPERASDAYVEGTFDKFSESFDQQLTQRLHYRAPQLCADRLERFLPPPAKQFDLLDAGCGTGLCGPLVAPWARRLTGVDLSRGMLDRARSKGVYDALEKAELTAFLEGSPDGWDAVVSADTLCYFGGLEAVLAAAGRALRPGGTLVFTVEALPEDAGVSWRLQPHGRYAHSRAYLENGLAAAGLEVASLETEVLRREGGEPVPGWVVAARRPL